MQPTNPKIPPTPYPAALLAACADCQTDPAALLAWAVREDAVVLILPNGQKYTYPLPQKSVKAPKEC